MPIGDLIIVEKSIAIVEKESKDYLDSIKFTGKAQVVLVFDRSGSTDPLFAKARGDRSIMAKLGDRLLGMALNLDDNRNVPVIVFDDHVYTDLPALTPSNASDYIERHVSHLGGGGTQYYKALEAILKILEVGDAVLVFFVTDGKDNQPQDTMRLMIELSKYPVFVQYLGVEQPNRPVDFGFLNKLNTMPVGKLPNARQIDNAGFTNLGALIKATDEQIYAALMNEFPSSFLPEARKMGLLPWRADNLPPKKKRFGLF